MIWAAWSGSWARTSRTVWARPRATRSTRPCRRGKKAWQWLSGGDGKGNVFQKAGDAASGAWDWVSGGDGKGNVFEKTGRAAGDLWSSLFG